MCYWHIGDWGPQALHAGLMTYISCDLFCLATTAIPFSECLTSLHPDDPLDPGGAASGSGVLRRARRAHATGATGAGSCWRRRTAPPLWRGRSPTHPPTATRRWAGVGVLQRQKGFYVFWCGRRFAVGCQASDNVFNVYISMKLHGPKIIHIYNEYQHLPAVS